MPYRRYSNIPSRRRRGYYRKSSLKGGMPAYRSRPRKGKYSKAYGRKRVPIPNSILSRDNYFCKLRFQDNINFGLQGAYQSLYLQYSLNSLYDPYYGVGGSTISGYDVLRRIWNRYMVVGALVKFKGTIYPDDPQDLNNADRYRDYAVYFQGLDSNESAAPPYPSIDDLAEQPSESTYRVITPAVGTNQRSVLLKKYFSIKSLEGCSITGNREEYSAFYNGNPTRQPTVLIGLAQCDLTGFFHMNLVGQLTIKYYCRLMNRVELS